MCPYMVCDDIGGRHQRLKIWRGRRVVSINILHNGNYVFILSQKATYFNIIFQIFTMYERWGDGYEFLYNPRNKLSSTKGKECLLGYNSHTTTYVIFHKNIIKKLKHSILNLNIHTRQDSVRGWNQEWQVAFTKMIHHQHGIVALRKCKNILRFTNCKKIIYSNNFSEKATFEQSNSRKNFTRVST